jgi:transcriptional regulator with XRE-family HTH domain
MNGMNVTQLLRRFRRRQTLPPAAERARIRQAVGLTQAEIAMVLGVDRTTVCRWERGNRQPRRTHLDKYVALLERLAEEPLRRVGDLATTEDRVVPL